MNFEEFRQRCEKIFALNTTLPKPTGEQCEKLYMLTQHMLEVNKNMNLTAITEPDAIILKHYADSVAIAEYMPLGAKIIDIGCGAGFPSIPLAIFREDLNIVSLDSTTKRIDYVSDTAKILGISNITAVAARAEDCAKKSDFRECFDVATARAVASLPILCELCLPYVKLGGTFVAMKSAKSEEEIAMSARAIEVCGGALVSKERADLTSDGENFETRIAVRVEKVKKTPDKYPRNYSQMSKKHL